MKIKPEIFLLNNKHIDYEKILVCGTDEAFISFVSEHIIDYFIKKNYFVERSGNKKDGLIGDLFSDKKILYVLNDYSEKNNKQESKSFDELPESLLITSSNNKNINKVKAQFTRSDKHLVLECYPLNRSGKEAVLRNFIEKNNLEFSGDVFWYILENLDNEYVLFIKKLEMLSLFSKNVKDIADVERAITVENKIDISKIFFQIFKKNNVLVKIFNKNIFSQSDLYMLINNIKGHLNIISASSNKLEAIEKFPKYLFNERDIFIKIFNSLDKNKIAMIYKNILKAETLIRKNSDLYNAIGLRFLLNIKKIIIS